MTFFRDDFFLTNLRPENNRAGAKPDSGDFPRKLVFWGLIWSNSTKKIVTGSRVVPLTAFFLQVSKLYNKGSNPRLTTLEKHLCTSYTILFFVKVSQFNYKKFFTALTIQQAGESFHPDYAIIIKATLTYESASSGVIPCRLH